MQQGKIRTAYTHCSHLILQVFSPSWCCVALQIPRLSICSITPECAAWMCYEPSALSLLLPPSHPFLFQVILRRVSPLTGSELQVRPGLGEDPLFARAPGVNNQKKKKDLDHWSKPHLLHKQNETEEIPSQAAVLLHCLAAEKQPFPSIHQHWRSEWECCQPRQLINGQYIAKKKQQNKAVYLAAIRLISIL